MPNLDWPAHIQKLDRDRELWVQSKADQVFEVGCQLDSQQYTFVNLTRAELERHINNCQAALMEAM